MSHSTPKIKAVFFDFMGTCLDWHSAVLKALPPSIPAHTASHLALDWRRRYFLANAERVRQRLGPEDIDATLARVLEAEILPLYEEHRHLFDEERKLHLIAAWHAQPAWPEVREAIRALREDLRLEVFVHANGTTRLQLDLARSSGLEDLLHMMFSSQLLGVIKPQRGAYEKGLELVGLRGEEVVMVAAHASDLRGAKECGLKTIYVDRWTDDVDEDKERIRGGEFDEYLGDMKSLPAVVKQWL